MPRIAEQVAWVVSSTQESAPPRCLISKVPDQQPFLLEGPGVLLWLAWEAGLSLKESIDEAAEIYGLDPGIVEPDVRQLHEHLLNVGVLVPDEP